MQNPAIQTEQSHAQIQMGEQLAGLQYCRKGPGTIVKKMKMSQQHALIT